VKISKTGDVQYSQEVDPTDKIELPAPLEIPSVEIEHQSEKENPFDKTGSLAPIPNKIMEMNK